MNKLPIALGSVVGSLALYVGILSFNLSIAADELESLVLPHIKNIDSAKFSTPLFATNNQIACMAWHTMNASGGYESFKTASFSNTDSGWILNKLDSNSCNQELKASNTKT